jgi:hypothetical protein
VKPKSTSFHDASGTTGVTSTYDRQLRDSIADYARSKGFDLLQPWDFCSLHRHNSRQIVQEGAIRYDLDCRPDEHTLFEDRLWSCELISKVLDIDGIEKVMDTLPVLTK